MFTFTTLHEHPHFVNIIAKRHFKLWSKDYIKRTNWKTEAQLAHYYKTKCCNPITCIPHAHIVIETSSGNLVAFAFIDTEDMGIRTDLYPWLVSIFVEPQYRNKGIGTMLIFHILNTVKLPTLHLWTFTESLASYYKKFGFEEIDRAEEGFIVMKRDNRDITS